MRTDRRKRLVAATLAGLLVLQGSPLGMLTARAEPVSSGSELEEELAAKSDVYPQGGFAFYEKSAAAAEGDGDIAVQVVRWGDTSQAATLDVKAVDLTAAYGEDYTLYYKTGPFTSAEAQEEAPEPAAEDAPEDADAAEPTDAQTPSDDAEKDGAAEDSSAADEDERGGVAASQGEPGNATDDDGAADGTDVSDDADGADDADPSDVVDEAPAEEDPTPADDPAEEDAAPEEVVEATPVDDTNEPAEQDAPAEDEDFETTSPLRTAYSTQTGKETVNTNWRGEYEDYLGANAAVEGANELSEAMPGAKLTLSFAEGEYAKTVYIRVIDDDKAESKEAFKLLLGNASTGVLAEQMQFDVSIADNEEPEDIVFALTDTSISVDADAEAAEVTIERQSGLDYYAGVRYRTAAGTAEPGVDYESADGVTVAFAPGETEKTVEIPLTGEAGDGDYFTVLLDSDAANVAEGADEARVTFAGDTADGGATSVETASVAPAAEEPAVEPRVLSRETRTVSGVTYDVEQVSLDGMDGEDTTLKRRIPQAAQATDAQTRVPVRGQAWVFGQRRGKRLRVTFGGVQVADRSTNSRYDTFTDSFQLNWAQSQDGWLSLRIDSTGANYHGIAEADWIKLYFPRYTLTLSDSDAKQKLTGTTWTSASTKSGTFSVDTLSGGKGWSTKTVGRNGSTDLNPGSLTNGVQVTGYDLYVNNTYAAHVSGSTISYSTLNNLRSKFDKDLRNNRYTVRVRPCYSAKTATVTFESEDASAVGFSGDLAGTTGFKTTQTVNVNMIDKISFTANGTSDQEIAASKVTRSLGENSANIIKTFAAEEGSDSVTGTFDVDNDHEYVKVYYRDLTLTYEYTPEEATAANANAGAISIYNANNLDEPIGVSSVAAPFTMSDRLSLLNNTFVARTILGEGFDHYETQTPNGPISFTTRTIWTYRDPEDGRYTSAAGNAFVFQPYYGDDVVNYHFKATQDDETQVGVTGSVYVDEVPLFSANETVKSTPAVGALVNVGGYNARVGNDGTYSIGAHFNKGEYLAAFLSYDTLSMASEVALSRDTVQDFHIKVNESERLTVTDSTVGKKIDTEVRDMETNEPIYEVEPASTMLLEDAPYVFTVGAAGEAGVTPARAEFMFYDKSGEPKDDYTQTVEFDGSTATLEINPMSMPVKSGGTQPLEAGDSMTVKLYDTNGTGYFEHQTSIIVGEKVEGMYTFNYTGAEATSDNSFVSMVGGLGILADFGIDTAASDGGTYVDEAGRVHQLMYIGYGAGIPSSGDVNADVYGQLQNTVADLDNVDTGTINVDGGDSIKVFDNDVFNLNVGFGIILDTTLEDEGEHKGEFMFEDYLLVANMNASFSKEWSVPVSIVTLTFGLDFSAGDEDSDGVSVIWNFYNPSETEEYYLNSSSGLDLLTEGKFESVGKIKTNTNIAGSVAADVLGMIGVSGSLGVGVDNTVAYDGSKSDAWTDYGTVVVSPEVALSVLGADIPVWSGNWSYDWNTADAKAAQANLAARMAEGLSTENILFTPTSEAEAVDLSYTCDRSGWSEGGVARVLSLITGANSAEDVEGRVLQEGFLADSDISVVDLGGGRMLAAFLDVVPGRDEANAMGAYYSVFDGSSWSAPQLLEDDGTEDEVPVVREAGDLGYLIAWSDASEKLSADDDLVDRLNSFDLSGVFFDPSSNGVGEVMQITHSTAEDTVADSNPVVAYDEETGSLHVYYVKSEYSVSDAGEGEVVGDLLNPYQLIAMRSYDAEKGAWSETYTPERQEEIEAGLPTGTTFEEYQENWYGQVFLDIAPTLEVSEQLDADGYWVEGTTAPEVHEVDRTQSMVRESDTIGYNGLNLVAYSLDKGGMAQETHDQNLYLQIYNIGDDEFHHPIQITAEDAEISDVQFLRSAMTADDGEKYDVTWLYWREQTATRDDEGGIASTETRVRRLNVTELVRNEGVLKTAETEDGQTYYYIDKTYHETSGYRPADTLVASTQEAEAGEDFTSIGSFKVHASADGRYNYVAWTQTVPVTREDGATQQEMQLFVTREDTQTGETSMPVQATRGADQYLGAFDFSVAEDGSIRVLAARQELAPVEAADEATGASITQYLPDDATTALTYYSIAPSTEVKLGEVELGEVLSDDEGGCLMPASTTVNNESFEALGDLEVTVSDAKTGEQYSSTADPFETAQVTEVAGDDGGVMLDMTTAVQEPDELSVAGGENYPLDLNIPVSEDGSYNALIQVRQGEKVLAETTVEGTVAPNVEVRSFTNQITERDHVTLEAELFNNGDLPTGERTVTYGYVDENGEKVELGTQQMPSLEGGASHALSADVEVPFDEFSHAEGEDGSIVDSREFYLEVNVDGFAPASTTAELTATASEAELMAAGDFSAKPALHDEDQLQLIEGNLEVGDAADLALMVGDKVAQNTPEYTNGYKVVWEPQLTDKVQLTESGDVVALGTGTVTLKGLVMPADYESELEEGALGEAIDNYATLPASLIKPIEVSLTFVEDTDGVALDGVAGITTPIDELPEPPAPPVSDEPEDEGSSDRLAGTGDVVNLPAIGAVTLVGALLVVAGIAIRRNRRKDD